MFQRTAATGIIIIIIVVDNDATPCPYVPSMLGSLGGLNK